jgi:hypothetical protein
VARCLRSVSLQIALYQEFVQSFPNSQLLLQCDGDSCTLVFQFIRVAPFLWLEILAVAHHYCDGFLPLCGEVAVAPVSRILACVLCLLRIHSQ